LVAECRLNAPFKLPAARPRGGEPAVRKAKKDPAGGPARHLVVEWLDA